MLGLKSIYTSNVMIKLKRLVLTDIKFKSGTVLTAI